MISHDNSTNFFDFYTFTATMTFFDRIDSFDAPTTTEGVSYGVRFTAAAAAAVETANYQHRHRNRSYVPLIIQDSIFES
jgi:hypothetical protein